MGKPVCGKSMNFCKSKCLARNRRDCPFLFYGYGKDDTVKFLTAGSGLGVKGQAIRIGRITNVIEFPSGIKNYQIMVDNINRQAWFPEKAIIEKIPK